MTDIANWINSPGVLYSIRLPGFEVCWAGSVVDFPGFCFGSVDGQLICTDEGGQLVSGPVGYSEEAINGVAVSQQCLAVSTSREVQVFNPHTLPGEQQGIVTKAGAHGIWVLEKSALFVAPMGESGLCFVKPGANPGPPFTSRVEGVYFYRVVPLSSYRGDDLILSAVRAHGLFLTELVDGKPDEQMKQVMSLDELDVVDVCSAASSAHPLAAIGLARNGTIVIIRDLLRDPVPLRLRFNQVEGVAYRVVFLHNLLFILTSKALYVARDLETLFLNQGSEGIAMSLESIPIDAADLNIVRNRWLLLVTNEEVVRVDTTLIPTSPPVPVTERFPVQVTRMSSQFVDHEKLDTRKNISGDSPGSQFGTQ